MHVKLTKIYYVNANCFNSNRRPWCQLDLVDIICQKVVCTQTGKPSMYHSDTDKFVTGLQI
jgi:hypothetical protein